MSFGCLAFAAEHRLAITFVVMNNGVLGNVVDALRGLRYAVDLPAVDYASVAAAFGLLARRVSDETALRAAFADGEESGGPVLIEVLTDTAPSSASIRYRG